MVEARAVAQLGKGNRIYIKTAFVCNSLALCFCQHEAVIAPEGQSSDMQHLTGPPVGDANDRAAKSKDALM